MNNARSSISTPSRIYFVMGKGGVGRSNTTQRMGSYFASKNESCLLVECNASIDIPTHFGQASQGYQVQHLENNLDCISISAMSAIEDYVIQQLKLRKFYTLIFENRLVAPLIEAAPGLHDAVQLGKIYDLWKQNRWQHIIVDAPATGHGLSLITAAQTMMNISRRGPLYTQNALVDTVIRQNSHIILVTLPEELPLKETIQLWNSLGKDFQKTVLGVIINKWSDLPKEFSENAIPPETLEHLQKIAPIHFQRLQQWQNEYRVQHKQFQAFQTAFLTPNRLSFLQQPIAEKTLFSTDFQRFWS